MSVLAVVLLAGGGILTLNQIQQQQQQRSNADTVQWYTSQSATSVCGPDATAVITATFTNTETSSSMGMNVVVKDNQTGKSVNMGTVAAKQTKSASIDTGKSSLNSGQVTFNLTWSSGQSGSDSRTAPYPAVSKCVAPTNTPTPTPKNTPTPTPTPKPNSTPTPTPTACPTPGTVKNIQIKCPYCSPTPSSGA